MPVNQTFRFRDSKCPLEERVEDLLSSLTLEEKLSLCAGAGFWKTKPVPRLGIKAFRLTDGPRGIGFHSTGKRCTAFPSGIAQAATWDTVLMARLGEALGKECRATGGRTLLGPAINITRTPLCGRTFEYLSEDPHLNSRLVVPLVQGIQRQGVAACIKHFAVNNQESNRVRVSAEVSERALQEIYLPAFRAAVEEADAWAVMAAYNGINGTPACENEDLLKRRLRDEWGFRGFVVSDWFAARFTSSTEACVRGGLSLEMPGKGARYTPKKLREGLAELRFTEADIDANLSGLLRAMILTGHLDSDSPRGERNIPEHRALALELAVSSATLLKNDRKTLPLDCSRSATIALLGPRLDKRNCLPLWGGSAGVWPPDEITPLRGMQEENEGRFTFVTNPAKADAVILFVGLSHRPGLDSEVKDRASLALPWEQDDLVRKTLAINPNTIVVLTSGSPVAMPWADDVPAILQSWYAGMEGGRAIARLLFGDSNPSGKLPVTFPRSLEDISAHSSPRTFPGSRETVHYEEELMVGYRDFDKRGIEPLYPFGHGLSYTHFAYHDLEYVVEPTASDSAVVITMMLINEGEVAGAEVVQLYVADRQAGSDRPDQALRAFIKVSLEAGARQALRFTLRRDDLAYFCPKANSWRVRGGDYDVRLGSSSRDIRLRGTVHITE
jgi:beta-glucosidase